MKSMLFTLLVLAPLSTLIAKDSTITIRVPLSNSFKYNAKLTKIMTHGEYKQFTFESIIQLNRATSTADIEILSYQDTGNIYCNFEKDIQQQAVAAIATWLSQNTRIQNLIVTIKNHDGQTIGTDYTMRECQRYLINDEWNGNYTLIPSNLIG